MNRKDIMDKLQNILRNIFEDDSLIITESTSANDIEEWDSLEHVNIIVTIEKQFKIKLQMNEISLLKNIGEMATLIERKLA